MQFSFFSLLKLHNLVLSLKKKKPVQCYSNWDSWVSLNESMSILCSLRPKTLRLSWKDRSFFEKLQSFSLLSSISFFSPNFHKEFISSLSLSLVRPRYSTKFALYLFATNEQVLDLEELDTSKEDLESNVYRITM